MAAALVAATLPLSTSAISSWRARIPLASQTVALAGPGTRVQVGGVHGIDPSALPAGSRVLTGAEDEADLRAAEEDVLETVQRATAQLSPDTRELISTAALDLHVLGAGLRAPIAGGSGPWRYVWPRDAAHVARAWILLGMPQRAAAIVRELARICGSDGWFEARYLPGRSQAPDNRHRQLDGTGWFLWALEQTLPSAPDLGNDAGGTGHRQQLRPAAAASHRR